MGWITLHQWLIVVSSSAIIHSSRLRLAIDHPWFHFVVFLLHWAGVDCCINFCLYKPFCNQTAQTELENKWAVTQSLQFKYLPISNVTLQISKSFHDESFTDGSESQKGNHRRPNIVNAGGCWKRHTVWFSVEWCSIALLQSCSAGRRAQAKYQPFDMRCVAGMTAPLLNSGWGLSCHGWMKNSRW